LKQFLYRGEIEEEFYQKFTQVVEYKIDANNPNNLEVASEPPYGVIIVAKDHESCWISYYKYYLGWKIVFAPVAIQFVKGYKEGK